MSTQEKIKANKLLTGVPVLDEIVGGGLPTFSFNIIARAPGSGKKTQARQIVFANAFSALDFEVPSQRFEWRADSNWWARLLGLTQH